MRRPHKAHRCQATHPDSGVRCIAHDFNTDGVWHVAIDGEGGEVRWKLTLAAPGSAY